MTRSRLDAQRRRPPPADLKQRGMGRIPAVENSLQIRGIRSVAYRRFSAAWVMFTRQVHASDPQLSGSLDFGGRNGYTRQANVRILSARLTEPRMFHTCSVQRPASRFNWGHLCPARPVHGSRCPSTRRSRPSRPPSHSLFCGDISADGFAVATHPNRAPAVVHRLLSGRRASC